MSEEMNILHSEIERTILEMDDWLEIAALTDSMPWLALVRRMAETEKLQLDRLLNEKDQAEFRNLQGYLAAYRDLRESVESASATAKNQQELLAEKQQEKDDLIAQEE
jgi:hypothetical protein